MKKFSAKDKRYLVIYFQTLLIFFFLLPGVGDHSNVN